MFYFTLMLNATLQHVPGYFPPHIHSEADVKNDIAQLRAEMGLSQAQMAEKLGISRQTVIALERSKTDPGLGLAMKIAWLFGKPVESIFVADLDEKMAAMNESWEFKNRAATAFNEVGVLKEMGADGWEMVGFGVAVLKFRRPENEDLRVRWEYKRLDGLMLSTERTTMEDDRWLYCGSWMAVYHYFNREAR
jgi:DNA-binding XRE family transcriptional regulator